MHADAILDRLNNSSYVIELRGRSLRKSTAVARKLKAVNKKETDALAIACNAAVKPVSIMGDAASKHPGAGPPLRSGPERIVHGILPPYALRPAG